MDEFDESEAEEEVLSSTPTRTSRADSFIGQLDWDEDYDSPRRFMRREHTARPVDRFLQVPSFTSQGSPIPQSIVGSPARPPSALAGRSPREETPLLHKKPSRVSFSKPFRPHVTQDGPPATKDSPSPSPGIPSYHATAPALSRRLSGTSLASSKGVRYNFGGRSTFGQTVSFLCVLVLRTLRLLTSALQLHCYPFGHWHAFRAVGVRLLWLGNGHSFNYFLWFHRMLHVSHSGYLCHGPA